MPADASTPVASMSTLGIGALDLRDVLQKLRRRSAVIVSTMALLTLFSAIVVFQLTPLYTATTKILIGARKSNVVDIDQVLGGIGRDSATVQSEIQVLTSRGLAHKVVDKLALDELEEFNPELRPPGLLSMLNPVDRLPDAWQVAIKGPSEEAEAESVRQERIRSQVADNLLRTIRARSEGHSRVISISVDTSNPRLSAQIANTLASLYLVAQLEAKYEATRRATDWLNERVEELRIQTETAERAVEVYRQRAGLIEGQDSTLAQQQVSQINAQLILARAETAEAAARLAQVETLVRSPNGVESAGEVLASPLIQRLREQQAEVERRAAEMATEYGPKHPKMINIRAEIADLHQNILGEVDKIVMGLRNEVGVAQAREQTLQGDLTSLTAEVGELNNATVELRALEREAAANRTLLDTYLSRLKETGEQDDLQQADATVISRADVPVFPSFPRKALFIVMGAVLSMFLGVGLAFLVEHLDPGFRSSEQIEAALGARTLSLVPLISRLKRLGSPPERYVLEKPTSSFAESLRTLHTSLLLSGEGEAPRTVLLTSSLPLEGKTTTAISLGRLLAASGKPVLLIDGDLRKPRAAKALGLEETPGLTDMLHSKTVTLESVIQLDAESGLHVLPAGTRAASPPDLLGSDRFASVLQGLKPIYDLILMDSAPVLVVSDTRALARQVDATVLVVRWAETRRETAALAMQQLRDAGAEITGVALTVVDVRKNAQYGYGDSGYYHYGPARRYYTN